MDDELTAIASSFPSELGGGLHGHAGLVKNDADYEIFAPGTPFVVPANPGVYPLGNIPAAQRGQREAEHKELQTQFQTCIGASKGLKDLILQAVDEDFLLELRAEGIRSKCSLTSVIVGGPWTTSTSHHFWQSATHRGMLRRYPQNTSIEQKKLDDS